MKLAWPWLFFLLLSLPIAQAQQELCEMFDFIECTDSFAGSRAAPASRSTSGASMPSSKSTQNINPATISTDKGFGLETLHNNGSFDLNFVTGSGAIGSGFSTFKL